MTRERAFRIFLFGRIKQSSRPWNECIQSRRRFQNAKLLHCCQHVRGRAGCRLLSSIHSAFSPGQPHPYVLYASYNHDMGYHTSASTKCCDWFSCRPHTKAFQTRPNKHRASLNTEMAMPCPTETAAPWESLRTQNLTLPHLPAPRPPRPALASGPPPRPAPPPPTNLASTAGLGGGGTVAPIARASASIFAIFLEAAKQGDAAKGLGWCVGVLVRGDRQRCGAVW